MNEVFAFDREPDVGHGKRPGKTSLRRHIHASERVHCGFQRGASPGPAAGLRGDDSAVNGRCSKGWLGPLFRLGERKQRSDSAVSERAIGWSLAVIMGMR
jgi:hypothetical protein